MPLIAEACDEIELKIGRRPYVIDETKTIADERTVNTAKTDKTVVSNKRDVDLRYYALEEGGPPGRRKN